MEITGKIIAVLPAQSGVAQRTGNPWKSQEYVIETHDTYPKKCCFKVFGDEKIGRFNIQTGEEVTVSFDINAREYNGKWFNSVDAWNITRVGAAQGAPQSPVVRHSLHLIPRVESITDESLESNCSIIEKIPPKGESFSDFIATFAMSVGFDTYFDLQHQDR